MQHRQKLVGVKRSCWRCWRPGCNYSSKQNVVNTT